MIKKSPKSMTNYRMLVYAVVLLLLLISCETEHPERPISISFVNSNSGAEKHQAMIRYINDAMIAHKEIVQPGTTIFLENTARDFADFSYQQRGQNAKYYLLQPGDSAVMSMDRKAPTLQVLNRAATPQSLNIENSLKADLYNHKHTPTDNFIYYWNMANQPDHKQFEIDMSEELIALKKKALKSLGSESIYLDSMKSNAMLDDKTYAYYQFKNQFDHEKIALYQTDKIDFSDIEKVKRAFAINNPQDTVLNPALFIFYYEFLISYAQELMKNEGTDTFTEIKHLRANAKEAFTFIYFDELLKTSYTQDGKELLKQLDSNLPFHDQWVAHFTSLYNLDQQPGAQWKMIDPEGQDLTFGDFLRRNKGKVIYIDVWAGWCRPCIAALPDSKKLASRYQDKPVSFAYFALDATAESWHKSSERYLTHHPSENYFLDSLNRIKVMETFNFSSIPRYLIFDQAGKLIDQDAPRPGTAEIKNLIDGLLEN